MDSSSLECGVCSNVFSDDYCPRILPCSHTFCSHCINGILSSHGMKACPLCRSKLKAKSAEDLLINRGLLDVAKQLASTHTGYQASFRGQQNSVQEFAKKGLSDCQKLESQVTDTIDMLTDIKTVAENANVDIKKLKEMCDVIMLSNVETINDIDKSISHLRSKLSPIKQLQKKIQECDTEQKAARSLGGKQFDDFQRIIKETQDFLHKNESDHDNVVTKVRKMKTWLEKVTEETKRRADEVTFVNLKMDDLKTLCENSEDRETYAVKQFGGKQIVSPICLNKWDDKVFLEYFAEEDIPPNSIVVKFKPLRNMSSRRSFLDFTFDGRELGRIVIKVMDKGNKGLNFLHMCAGDLGPSYNKSRVLGLHRRGKEGENIVMGNYETQDGTSANPVMPQINWDEEEKKEIYETTSPRVGEVRGWFSRDRASRFYIVLRDHPSLLDNCCFGMVEEGLHVLRDPDIHRAEIDNCGVIFSF